MRWVDQQIVLDGEVVGFPKRKTESTRWQSFVSPLLNGPILARSPPRSSECGEDLLAYHLRAKTSSPPTQGSLHLRNMPAKIMVYHPALRRGSR